MSSQGNQLPTRFPVGTKFVIESRPARGGSTVYSRYVELPDGKLFALPPRTLASKARRQRKRR